MAKSEQLSLNHLSLLLRRFEGNLNVVTVPLREDQLTPHFLKLLSDLAQALLSLESHICSPALDRLILLELVL